MEVKNIAKKVKLEDLGEISRGTERVSAAVPKEIRQKLDRLKAKGKSPSKLVRALLEAFFDNVDI